MSFLQQRKKSNEVTELGSSMRISRSFQALVVAVASACSTGAMAQTYQQASSGDGEYPWRVGNGQVQPSDSSSTAGPILIQPGVQAPAPEAPVIGLDKVVRPSGNVVADAVPQPKTIGFGDVPAAPSDDVYNNVVQPELAVQSKSNDQETDYCFRSKPQWCNLGCHRRLFNRPVAGIEIGGFAQFGYHARNILPFNDRRNRFNLHQAWLHFEKNGFTPGGSDIRYRVDAVYGLDAQELQAVGNTPLGAPADWDNGFDHGSFGWAIPQAFVEVSLGEWQVKMGKFLSPIGYEAAPSTENFFYSRTYARRFIEPFSHSGVLAQRNVGAMTQIVGVTAGWDTAFESNSGGFNLLTGMRFQPNSRTRISTTSSIGDTGYRGSGTLWSGVAEVQLAPKVQYIGQFDMLGLQTSDEFAFINSLYYCHNRCLAFGSRLEWWKSDQLQAATSSTYDFTMGLNYRPNANILFRPEVRWDWGQSALDNGDVNFGCDMIMTF